MVLLMTARAMDEYIYPRLNWARKLTRARTTMSRRRSRECLNMTNLQGFGHRYVFVMHRFSCCMYGCVVSRVCLRGIILRSLADSLIIIETTV